MESHPQGILGGIRVVELATYIFAPAAAMIMADFGADVVKVEAPGDGDPNRRLHMVPPLPACETEYCFLLDGRGKRCLALDLKQESGREAMLRLLKTADVFVTNFRPSVLARLKLAYDDLRALNERLIFAHATGYGLEGDEVEKPGYDMTAYWARSGLMDSVRAGESDPAVNLAGMGDHPSAMSLFAGVMLALYARAATGKGTRVAASLLANGAWSNGSYLQGALVGAGPYVRRGRMEADNVLINHYVTRDGKRFMLCAPEAEKSWPRLCRALGRPEWIADARGATPAARRENSRALIAEADAIFRSRDFSEWKEILKSHELPWSPISTNEETARDAQALANDVFVEMEHPALGKIRTVNTPMILKDHPKTAPRAPRGVGQDTREILLSLGYAAGEIDAMIASGIAAV